MTESSKQALKQQDLRRRAEDKLKRGSAPPTQGWLSNLDALNLLHQLASTPGSSADALKLLHELQVHQVELDLQHEQLETSERELTEDLVRSLRLYDFSPVASISVNLRGEITRVNIAGAAICGEDRPGLMGRQIDDFLEPESRPVLAKLATHVRNGIVDKSCEVRTSAGKTFVAKASLVPGESAILIVFMDVADSISTASEA